MTLAVTEVRPGFEIPVISLSQSEITVRHRGEDLPISLPLEGEATVTLGTSGSMKITTDRIHPSTPPNITAQFTLTFEASNGTGDIFYYQGQKVYCLGITKDENGKLSHSHIEAVSNAFDRC